MTISLLGHGFSDAPGATNRSIEAQAVKHQKVALELLESMKTASQVRLSLEDGTTKDPPSLCGEDADISRIGDS